MRRRLLGATPQTNEWRIHQLIFQSVNQLTKN